MIILMELRRKQKHYSKYLLEALSVIDFCRLLHLLPLCLLLADQEAVISCISVTANGHISGTHSL